MFFVWHLIHLHGLLFLCNLVRQNTLGLNSLDLAGLCIGVGKNLTYDAIFLTNHVDHTFRHTCIYSSFHCMLFAGLIFVVCI